MWIKLGLAVAAAALGAAGIGVVFWWAGTVGTDSVESSAKVLVALIILGTGLAVNRITHWPRIRRRG